LFGVAPGFAGAEVVGLLLAADRVLLLPPFHPPHDHATMIAMMTINARIHQPAAKPPG
jgi:hypothetical protein